MSGVDKMTDAQAAAEAKRALPRLLYVGTDAMRKAGSTYLPKHPLEDETAWQARVDVSVLLPAFRDAVDLASGLIFRKPVHVDAPEDAQDWFRNVDLVGQDVTQFSRTVFNHAAVDGIGFIVVDYPRVPQGVSLKVERDMGVRPYWVHVKAEQVLGWRTQNVNGKQILTQFRYQEAVEVADGMFGTKTQQRIRVLEPQMVTVYVKKDNDWEIDVEASGATTMEDVPVVPVYTGRTGFIQGLPPLADLAWTNVKHWQSSSDQQHILHVARVPILFGSGFSDDSSLVASPNSAILGPQDSTLAYVEHSGAAIEAGRQDLQDLKDEMQRMAGKIINEKVMKTATESGVESTQAMSRIQAWALGLQHALDLAMEFSGKWAKRDVGKVRVNTDVDTAKPDAQMLTEIRNATIGGLLSKETYLQVLQDAEVLPEGFDVDEELDRIDIQAPDLAPIPDRGAKPEKKPSSARIKHADGTETTVTLED